MENELLTSGEVKQILRIKQNTFNQLNCNGTLKPIRLNKRTLRYRKSDIEKLIGGDEAPATDEVQS